MTANSSLDLLVIGAGWSGLMAAHTASRAGLSVKVITKGLGSMHWATGCIDLFGYAPDAPEAAIKRPLDYVANKLAKEQPQHPYALLGKDRLVEALDSFIALANELGLPYGGAAQPGENLLLPTAVGAARPTYLAPQAQLGGDLARAEPMVIVGFEGLRDFYPQLIAENLAKQGFAARAAFLPYDVLTDRRDSNTVQQAHGMDEPARRSRLISELKKLAQPGERIGLPPILGLDDHTTVLFDMQSQTGATVFEIPTLPPSVPGMRLFKAWRSKLNQAGVRVDSNMEVISAASEPSGNGAGSNVRWVESATSSRPMKHRAGGYLLATGGIMGGGFYSDHTGQVWETIFDLPLTVPQARSQWFNPSFINPAGHPVFSGGVAVNTAMQPVDAEGAALYGNLWAAGDLLAHDNPILQRSLEGAAIATGFAAGQAAAAAG
ncbi:MAG: glycerol-3-phosphate dehydrogenase subunit GlpB [Anaerolineae bacterium]|nr:glycerol-3-phosphate dehydrogenase subunit GlpB [Anaerolineae bacterium]